MLQNICILSILKKKQIKNINCVCMCMYEFHIEYQYLYWSFAY